MPKGKLGQEPAFPALEHNEAGYGDCVKITLGQDINYIPFTKGMSKRYFTACIALNALIIARGHLLMPRGLVREAYEIADMTLEVEANND